MFVPAWALVGLVAVFIAGLWLRAQSRKHQVAVVRRLWTGLPRARRQEILYVRERIHLNGDRYLLDYERVPDDTLQEWFENSLRNALDGEGWAFELLKEQVWRHASDEGLLSRDSRPPTEPTGPEPTGPEQIQEASRPQQR
jgi:hypothetical protein